MPRSCQRVALALVLGLSSCRVPSDRRPLPQASIASTNAPPTSAIGFARFGHESSDDCRPAKNKACEACEACGHGVVYGRRFANAQRNSLAQACLCRELKRKVDVTMNGSAMRGPLLTGGSPDWLGTSTPIPTSGLNASVDLKHGVITPANVHVLPDDRLAMFWYDGYSEAPLDAEKRERIATMNLPPPPVLGYYATTQGFIQARDYYADKSAPCQPGARCSRPRARKD